MVKDGWRITCGLVLESNGFLCDEKGSVAGKEGGCRGVISVANGSREEKIG